MLDVRRAELLDVGLEVHRAHHALLSRPARVREVDVDERRDDVQVLRVRQVVEEREDEQRVRPPEHAVARVAARATSTAPSAMRERRATRPSPGRTPSGCTTSRNAFDQQQRDHQPADHAEDDQRVGVLELVALEPPRMQHEPPIEREADRAEDEQREHVLRQRVDAVERRRGRNSANENRGNTPCDQDLDRAGREHHEAPEDQRVHRAGDRIAEDLRLRDADRRARS